VAPNATNNPRADPGSEGRGFEEIAGGKGSHRKFVHACYRGAVTLSGQIGDDAKPYREKQVRQAVEDVQA
jgi:predicted RNA binding protein YcfA (HicA-like mRNA interferase family)